MRQETGKHGKKPTGKKSGGVSHICVERVGVPYLRGKIPPPTERAKPQTARMHLRHSVTESALHCDI